MSSFGVGIETVSSGIILGVEAEPAWKRLLEVATTTAKMGTPTNIQECNSEQSRMQPVHQDTLEGLSSVGLLLQGPPRPGQKRKAYTDGLCSIEEKKWYLRKRLLHAYPQLRENLQILCSDDDFNNQLTKDIADGIYTKIKRKENCSAKASFEANLVPSITSGSGEIGVSSCLHSTSTSLVHQDLLLPQKNIGAGFTIDRITDVANMVVEDLNTFGICVVDDFLGSQQADKVFEDVNVLYKKGIFHDGTVVSQSNQGQASQKFRGDQITWVSGSENACSNTRQLVAILDAIISTTSKHTKPGKIGKYNITTRTRAMVACYPGSGARYVKHVDNPNGDGRCITTIYYLNKYWQKDDGGVLRLYPEDSLHKVAEIEPLFDRMVFFWSDRRNPHEVLPAKMTRFAITVWYLNQDEREAYISRRISND